MKYRHLLLITTVFTMFHAYVFIRTTWFIDMFATYGGDNFSDMTYGRDDIRNDIRNLTHFAIATLAVWAVLEIAANRKNSRGLVCNCGCALRGIKCPECGEPIGADLRAAAPTQK